MPLSILYSYKNIVIFIIRFGNVNSNTTPQHANSAGGSILGTSEIPKIETPVANDFVGDLPDAATTLSTKIVTDLTDKPKFK